MKPKRDYYEVLEVERDADARTIKRAFLRKARTCHPDVSDEPDAEEQFKEINEAYSVLSDEQARANYDRFGDPDGPSGMGGMGAVDMSDFFTGFGGIGDIFDAFLGRNGQARRGRTRGRDMGVRLTISLEEAAAGCTRTIAYERLAPCDDCDATGSSSKAEPHTCERCGGTGTVIELQRTFLGTVRSEVVCPECQGVGSVVDDPCDTCGGQGRAPQRERLEVTVPAGARSGQTVVIENMGEAGLRGAPCGDLVASIEVMAHERFERHGDDLVCALDVDALSAVVGTTVTIPGILEDESVVFEIQPGCQQGDHVVAHGFGMPNPAGYERGDLVGIIRITVPTDVSDAQRKLIQSVVDERQATLDNASAHEDAPEDAQ